MLSRRGVRKRLSGLFNSLIPNDLFECSHLREGLVFRDHLSSYDLGFILGFAQLVLQRPVISIEPGELPLEQPNLSLGLLEPLIPSHQLYFIALQLFLLVLELLLQLKHLALELPDLFCPLFGLVKGPQTTLVSLGHRHSTLH